MHEFKNYFTGEAFTGTVEQLFFQLEGTHDTISRKSDVVKSYGWYWDENRVIIA